jgi:hypothetical protein
MSNAKVAQRCGVDEQQLNAGFEAVDNLAPHQSRTVGRCTLTRSVGQERVLVVITKKVGAK